MRDNLIAALKHQAAEASCTGHYELSDLDDESYWDYTSFARLSHPSRPFG